MSFLSQFGGGITAAMVGLGNVNNTSDANKPVSTAQQTALNLKANLASPTFTGTVSGITAAMVGLGNVDNTADTAKPVSTAQQTALDLKAPIASPTFTGSPRVPSLFIGPDSDCYLYETSDELNIRYGVAAAYKYATFKVNGNFRITSGTLEVVSTDLVTNLNADLLDGQHGSYYAPLASPVFTGVPQTPAGFYVKNFGAGAPNHGGMVALQQSNSSTLDGSAVYVDIFNNQWRFYEAGGVYRGAYLDLTTAAAGVGSRLLTSTTMTSADVTTALGFTPGSAAGLSASVISTNTTATAGGAYVFTASLTLTLPASPLLGNVVQFSNMSGTTTCVIACNGKNILGVAEDMTIDKLYAGGALMYTDATRGWVFV